MKLTDLPNPYIIAEVGSCWSTFEHIKNSVTLAKNCGADAVKFQYFTYDGLYGSGSIKRQWGKLTEDYGESRELSEFIEDNYSSGVSPYFHHGWLKGLKEKADATGIDLLCSAFSVDGLKAVDPYVKMHKLASAENNHVRMLEKLNTLKKPVLLSTGGSTMGDIRKSLALLRDVEVMPLYCVSDYPAKRVLFSRMKEMKQFRGSVGFSDHSIDSLVIPQKAVEMGAQVIEKHVNFFDVDCADSPHSLSRDDFKAMCDMLKGRPVTESGQTEMVTKHNRRLIATGDIKAGDILREGENFGIYRSVKDDINALSPFYVDAVNGQPAKRDIQAMDGIGPGDVSLPSMR